MFPERYSMEIYSVKQITNKIEWSFVKKNRGKLDHEYFMQISGADFHFIKVWRVWKNLNISHILKILLWLSVVLDVATDTRTLWKSAPLMQINVDPFSRTSFFE